MKMNVEKEDVFSKYGLEGNVLIKNLNIISNVRYV